ncbi:alpha/beta fold hydrolase [Streptomyces yunnanensis]|uniref:Pimeloyl-ACP methyl ester carboxylesterase n=1 Tax=Streptomyces yunnanensis TaxID=156453 RepID=A0A9X8MTM5_9ACTN|nr:alpha/beta fold hydrolase [Streptomyces yunnanensis]SHL78000.1 Pimeloyl-ACP methyl ester carboxylesterase [Streptomyces yunnanensis]
MASVQCGEITVAYEDKGSGAPLVLIHGHPFDRSMWRPQTAHFSRAGMRVIAPDLRGYGGSSVVPGKTLLETFARDVAALLDHLGIERCVLGGLSMGGQIVMECYRQFPERIRGLLLADTFAAADTAEGRAVRLRTAERLLAEGMDGYAHEVLPKMIAPANVTALPTVAEHVLGMMRNASPEGAAAALRGRAERRDYTGLLPRITVPTLVVVGAEDEFTPVADARAIHQATPGSRLTVIQGAGHMPNLERPEEFNATLTEFLATMPAQVTPED